MQVLRREKVSFCVFLANSQKFVVVKISFIVLVFVIIATLVFIAVVYFCCERIVRKKLNLNSCCSDMFVIIARICSAASSVGCDCARISMFQIRAGVARKEELPIYLCSEIWREH